MLLNASHLARLQPGNFLNDDLVDFGLKLLIRERDTVPRILARLVARREGRREEQGTDGWGDPLLDAERVRHVHVFTAHFYKKLTSTRVTHLAEVEDKEPDNDGDEEENEVAVVVPRRSHGRDSADACGTRGDNEAAAHALVARWTGGVDLFNKRCRA